MTIATIMAFFVGHYTEAVSVMVLYKVGELLTEYAVNKSRKSIDSLINIKADVATAIVDEKEIVVSPEEIMLDDIIIVKPGERIPLDGVIIEGEASLDTSALTGESKYYDVTVNDKVLSGSININGYLKVKVTKLYNESMVSKIVDMVSNASLRKANTENIVSKFARYYTPIVCGLAVLIIIINLLFKIIDDIDAGNSNLSEFEQGEVLEFISRMTNKQEKLSKYQSLKYINDSGIKLSRATFDNYIKDGKLPKGRHQVGFKEIF